MVISHPYGHLLYHMPATNQEGHLLPPVTFMTGLRWFIGDPTLIPKNMVKFALLGSQPKMDVAS